MATCNIRLYGDRKNTLTSEVVPFELQLGKNWVVDDLIGYLSNKTLTTISNCQYIKDLGNLTMTLKLDLPQEIIEMGIDGYKYIRYIGLQNSDTSEWFYYFVTDYERLSENCINFILVMDSLNSTLSNVSYKRKLEFTDKTNITREHVDRFYPTPNGITYLRKIPMLPEGINPPLYKTKSIQLDTLQAGDYSKNNWYLIYRTEIKPGETDLTKIGNPIKCYLLNDLSIKVQAASTTTQYTLTADDFYSSAQGNNTLGFTKEDGNTGTIEVAGKTLNMSEYDYCYLYQWNKSLKTWLLVAGKTDSPIAQTLICDNLDGTSNVVFKGTWTKGHFLTTTYNKTAVKYLDPFNVYEAIYAIDQSTVIYPINLYADGYTKAFKDLDRTDSRLVKIICLPYCPINYTIVNDQFSFLYPWVKGTDWEIVDHMIQIKDINSILEVDLSKVVSDDTANYKELTQKISANEIQYDTPRFIPESKLYHSEFFQRTYFYDSFVYTVNLERMIVNPDDWREQDLTKTYLTYQMSNGIKSTMMFSFPTPQECEWYESANYSKYLIVNRNNEVSMYDNAYLDYIRNGYNYDQKVKNRSTTIGLINAFTGGLGSVIGLGTNFALTQESYNKFRNAYLDEKAQGFSLWGREYTPREAEKAFRGQQLGRIGQVASPVLQVAGNVVNTFINLQAQEDQLQQTLKTKALQATAVENADDLDLLKKYSGNKLSVTTYKVLPEMQKAISDLFYYTGSKVSYMGIPNTHRRLYFDFIQCNPVFKATYTWDSDVIVDVTSKLQEGVTFFHKVNNSYNFEQNYENWELFLIGDDN